MGIDEKELENMSIEEKIYWYRDNINSIENTINVLNQLSNKFIHAVSKLEMEINKTHKMCDHCNKYIDKRDIIYIKKQEKANRNFHLMNVKDNNGYVEVNKEICPICKSVISYTVYYSKFKKEE